MKINDIIRGGFIKQGNEQLDDVPIGWRPKTISGGGDANDLADFNTSLRHNKITSSVLDNRGEAVADVIIKLALLDTVYKIICLFFKFRRVVMNTPLISMAMNI